MVPIINVPATIADVPFHSQIQEIDSSVWKKQGCGITSLAMIIDFYNSESGVSVNKLLGQGIASGAYINNAGWSHAGLISLSRRYGLDGIAYDLSKASSANAFTQLKKELKEGPVIVSVYSGFDPKTRLPHLLVLEGIDNDTIYYNDPANKNASQKKISSAAFVKGWKKRFIVIRPKEVLAVKTKKISLSIPYSISWIKSHEGTVA